MYYFSNLHTFYYFYEYWKYSELIKFFKFIMLFSKYILGVCINNEMIIS